MGSAQIPTWTVGFWASGLGLQLGVPISPRPEHADKISSLEAPESERPGTHQSFGPEEEGSLECEFGRDAGASVLPCSPGALASRPAPSCLCDLRQAPNSFL